MYRIPINSQFNQTMFLSLNRKYLFTLNSSLVKPVIKRSFVTSQSNMYSSDLADKFSVAFVTFPDEDGAKILGHQLVRNKLAACVTIVPNATSIYDWKQEIHEDTDVLVMIKTRTSAVDRLTQFVRSNHPDDVAGVISLTIKNGNAPYLTWIGEIVPEK